MNGRICDMSSVAVVFVVGLLIAIHEFGHLLAAKLCGIPIERSSSSGVVEQMSQRFAASGKLWLGIAPEGTRKRVDKWKNGFWYIARAAGVPILPVYFDYPSRTIGLGPVFETTSDLDRDTAALRAFYAPFRGKHRGTA